ncbi:RWD-domain-containing protein [Setomelanomma holmii]|uniref:RBR-type E3 ubiquitin transferase n=1 Tax=Setomelanomma holmii TaxID=210430 RepID=A0A9P4H7D6_9PLEO|nr:RWD-domain-containing protein [Setomelanomma holmii]
MDNADDERVLEIESLQAIYSDELTLLSPFSAKIELAVALIAPLRIDAGNPEDVREQSVSFLPSLHVSFTLPDGYPAAPPQIQLHTAPDRIPRDKIDALLEAVITLWEENGRSLVMYDWLSFVQEQADLAFGLSVLVVAKQLYAELLSFNYTASKDNFNKASSSCGICLDDKRGSACHRMDHCHHVFCIQCLRDYYNASIIAGSVHLITPRELLQIPLERPAVQRYVDIMRKKKLETDKSTVWCPRKWCQGAACDNNYPKLDMPLSEMDQVYKTASTAPGLPPELNKMEPPNEEDELTKDKKYLADQLCVCEDCSFAFCKLCKSTWHGEHYDCRPRTQSVAGRLEPSKEEQASRDFVALHTTPCPSCNSCCRTHFCYLCSGWLSPTNPYAHFNTRGTPCFQRLWVLQDGDDAQAQVEFGGARGAEMEACGIVTADEERRRQEAMAEMPH